MMSFRSSTALVAAVCVYSAGAEAARSRLTCLDLAGGAKQISPGGIAESGPGQLPDGILGIVNARIRVVDSVVGAAQLTVTKSTLTPTQAFGAGLPNGYAMGGPLNPSGPWVGLMWPFRDFNDGHVASTSGRPLGNDVGTIAPVGTTGGQIQISGITTDMAFSLTDPASYHRGLPSNGGADFVQYFSFDVASTSSLRRSVTVFLEDVQVIALINDEPNGRVFRELQTAEDISITFEIPAPGAAPVLAGLALLATRRRRSC